MALPFILAGPILRRVEPRAVAVWVALSRPARVTLSVFEGLRKSGATAAPVLDPEPIDALRIGEHLYVALAVARLAATRAPLQPGVNYAYDLAFDQAVAPVRRTLATEGLLGNFSGVKRAPDDTWFSEAPLGYAAGLLPSFALPPALLTDLRIVYGSCRRTAAEHYDAMPWIDTTIDDAFTGFTRNSGATLATAANRRPHQLYLGGDQIYADDLSPLHLRLINGLAQQLISGTDKPVAPRVETLTATGGLVDEPAAARFPESLQIGRLARPGTAPRDVDRTMAPRPATLDHFPAGGRFDLTQFDGQFTSSDGESHLLSFGEFAGMYLTVYSDRFMDELDTTHVREVAQPPAAARGMAPPLCSMSLLDTKAAAWFDSGRWTAWNKAVPPAPAGSKPDDASVRRKLADHLLKWLGGGPRTLADFKQLTEQADLRGLLTGQQVLEALPEEPDKAVRHLQLMIRDLYGDFMTQMQARVMRALVRRFGIAAVADCDCKDGSQPILAKGPAAILGEARQRRQAYDEGGVDVWREKLDGLMNGQTWGDFVAQCLGQRELRPWGIPMEAAFKPVPAADAPVPDDADFALETGLVAQLAAQASEDPASTKDARKAFTEAHYTNLGRTMLGRCMASFADEVWGAYVGLHTHLRRIQVYRRGQPKVRRALANVATYMIFDDHDVTDDWNLNPEWYRRVYLPDGPRSQPLGRQVVRNALAAYAVFQDWGNDFVRYAPGQPGAQVLQAVRQLFTGNTETWPRDAATRELDRLFGLDLMPTAVDATHPAGRHAAPDPPMKWHYRVDGPQFCVAVLDNRTRRGFASKFGPPGNVGTTMIDDQIPAAPLPAGQEVLIVVAPLQVLAPSVFDEIVAPGAYRAFDIGAGGKAGSGRGGAGMPGLNPDAIESWALDPITMEALLARLAPHGKVVLLSGDVHNSTATQLSYWRKTQPDPSRIVQFTCSGFKNVMPSYLVVIDHGLAFAQELIRADLGGDRMGWLLGADDAFAFPPGKGLADVPLVNRRRIAQRPAHLPVYGWPVDTASGTATRVRPERWPDFSWTLRPVFDRRPDAARPPMARAMPFVQDLLLIEAEAPDAVPKAGRDLVVLARVAGQLLVRGFDANGSKVVDRTEAQLGPSPPLTELKSRITPMPRIEDLSFEQRQQLAAAAAALAGHALPVRNPPTAAQLAAKGAEAFGAYAQIALRHFRQLDRLGQSRQILFRSNFARVVFERARTGSGAGAREVLTAVHQVMTALPDPLDPLEQSRVPDPHLLKPELAMEQRAELTPPADAVRPEDRPLQGEVGAAVQARTRSRATRQLP